MIPSPTDLHYFLEVATQQNISRASENLGISQPSLTLAMRRLEEALGETILIRHKRGVTLTQAGKQLLAYTRQLLQHWESIKSESLATVNEVRGLLTIGCHPSVARFTLPLFLPNLLQKYPKLEIRLKHELSRKIVEQVIDLTIDVGIVVNPVKHPDLVLKKLFDDKITLWHAPIQHEIQDLSTGNAILLCDPDLTQTQFILKALKKKEIHFAKTIHSSSLEVIADLTEKGCGIGILPGGVAQSRQLTMLPKAPSYADEGYLLYRGENRNISAIQAIANAIKETFN